MVLTYLLAIHYYLNDIIFFLFFAQYYSAYKCANFNLNLPETQSHNYHLFDEQEVHQKKLKFSYNFFNSFSITIPILLAFNLFFFCFFFVNYLWNNDLFLEIFGDSSCIVKHTVLGMRNFLFYLIVIIWILFLWFENINFETGEGYHNSKVNSDYRLGFLLFLGSEVMFFFSIFWAFFHFSVGSSLDFGYFWPPMGIDVISYTTLPLFNTIILITSGLFITWSHNGLKNENFSSTFFGLLYTIIFGVIFLICQLFEYKLSNFNINDSVFGSIFFFGTGFHGMHVLLGTVALVYNFLKLNLKELSSISHYSYLFTIWYWHFVDIIWLFLYLIFYIWGQ